MNNNLHSTKIIKLKPWHRFAWKGSWPPSHDLFLNQMNSEADRQIALSSNFQLKPMEMAELIAE